MAKTKSRKKKSVSISADLFDWYKQRAEDNLVISAAAEIEHALKVFQVMHSKDDSNWIEVYIRACNAIHNYKLNKDLIALSEIIHNVRVLKEKYFVQLRQASFYTDFIYDLAHLDLSPIPEHKRGAIEELFSFL